MDTIKDNFLFEDHKQKFYMKYDLSPNKRVVLHQWKYDYLHHLYVAESERIVLKLNKNDEEIEKAFVKYSKRVPPLHRIIEVIEFWENFKC